MFCLTRANVDGRSPKDWIILIKDLYGEGFADRGTSPKTVQQPV
ncbi:MULTISPECIES: hypothetical protein [Bacteroides]|nr:MULTISPECIES: hypothetical protein [Bacteroides]